MNEEILKMFGSGVSAEEIFEEMESTVPTERCAECVHRHNAMIGGVNIFCSCMDSEQDCAIVTDYNANSCKHFTQKSEETDEIEKKAIEILIERFRED